MPRNSPISILPGKEWGDTEEASLVMLEAAGCYRLQCSLEILQRLVSEAGFALLVADLGGVKGKQNLLSSLASAASFPPEIGLNWDALADALCDLSWCGKPQGYVLLLQNASDTLGLSVNDREITKDLLDDTVVYWRQRKIPFWIFFC